MTSTDKLRRLLDEHGVEYEAYRDIKNRCITRWRTYHGAFAFFAVEKEGELFVETASDTERSAICTPEQAIAATLGNSMRTAELEELVLDLYADLCTPNAHKANYRPRFEALGIEVNENEG